MVRTSANAQTHESDGFREWLNPSYGLAPNRIWLADITYVETDRWRQYAPRRVERERIQWNFDLLQSLRQVVAIGRAGDGTTTHFDDSKDCQTVALASALNGAQHAWGPRKRPSHTHSIAGLERVDDFAA